MLPTKPSVPGVGTLRGTSITGVPFFLRQDALDVRWPIHTVASLKSAEVERHAHGDPAVQGFYQKISQFYEKRKVGACADWGGGRPR